MQEEVDLTRYIDMLIRKWWLILALALVCGAVAGVRAAITPVTYSARVLVATLKEDTRVSLSSVIRTYTEDELRFKTVEEEARFASFLELVKSPLIAESVLVGLDEQLPVKDRSAPALLGMIRAEAPQGADSIAISATHSDPQIAAKVANAWGREYVRQVNRIYGGPGEDVREGVRQAIEIAEENYEREQAALEELLREDRFDELSLGVAEAEAMMLDLSSARGEEAEALLYDIDLVEHLLDLTRDMHAQVQKGGSPAVTSNAYALTLLKVQVFTRAIRQSPQEAAQPVPARHPWSDATESRSVVVPAQGTSIPTSFQVQIQASPNDMTPEDMIRDLEALLATLEMRRDTLSSELATLLEARAEGKSVETSSLDVELEATIKRLEERLRELRAELAQEERSIEEAQAGRDLAWTSFDQLVRKDAELDIASRTAGAEVRLAMPALVPSGTGGRGPVISKKSIALGAAVGLVLGVFLVYAIEYLQGYRARGAKATATGGSKASQ